MAKHKMFFCTKCGVLKRHKYAGRAKGALIEELVMGALSLSRYQLLNVVSDEKVRGTTYWECSECKRIKEIS